MTVEQDIVTGLVMVVAAEVVVLVEQEQQQMVQLELVEMVEPVFNYLQLSVILRLLD